MEPAPVQILIDADACPVKDEVYKVALRHGTSVVVVANMALRVPAHPLISRKVVSEAFDAADDWIATQAGPHSVVITGDILLAERCLIMADLRAGADGITGGPAPFAKADRSRFLSALDEALIRLARTNR